MEDNHINSLEGGMFSDNDPSLQPKGTYRFGRNGNLITKGKNYFAYESLDGTVVNFSLPLHKTGSGYFMPIGWFRLGNRLMVHSTDDSSALGGDGEIGIVTFDNSGTGTYSAKYYHANLKYTWQKMISGYGLEENDAYHRSYWTDNLNQPRTINTASSVLTTEYLTTTLVVGEQYMVLTDTIGSITHNAVVYGPKQTAGNVFTAVNANFTTTGSAKVIKYLDPNILNYTPQKAIGTIDFLKYTLTGALYCGVKLYAYQLSTIDGYESSWSYTLNPIHVGPSTPGTYQNYVGAGYASLINSGKGIQLLISDIPAGFDKIKVAVIEMDQAYDTIRNIEVFYIADVTGTSMTITHNGQENLEDVATDDLALRTAVITRCKDIATLKQRQVMVNLTERTELDWDPTVGATLAPFVYTIPADAYGLLQNNMLFATFACPDTGVVSAAYPFGIASGGHYVVRGGTNVEYPVGSGTFYLPGETFIGIAGSTTFTPTGGAIVKGCIRIRDYTTFAGTPVYKIIDLEDEFFDYKSMATHCYLRGYWRGETYRIGVLAWDLFGNPYAIRFLGDIPMPSQSDVSGTYKLLNNNDPQYSLNALGINVSGIDITEIKDNISGISLVRVPRDETILAQGLIMQTADKQGEANTVVPISTVRPSYDHNATLVGCAASTWTLLGPEYDFTLSAFDIPLVSGDKLSPVADLDPIVAGGGEFMARDGVNQQVYSKYYIHNRWTGNDHNITLVHLLEASETYNYGSTTIKNHDIGTANSHPNPLGFIGPDPANGLQQKTASGGRRTLILTDTADFNNTSNGNIGTGVNIADIGTNRKLLVNYYRPKAASSLYGGTSDAAKANNQYIFCGHYLKIDSTVLANIVNGSNRYILNGMELWGGDCFVQLYSRASSCYDEDYADPGSGGYLDAGSYSWGVIFPVESNINTGLREGRNFTKDGMHNNANGVWWNLTVSGSATNHNEDYHYNPSYSSLNDKITYAPLPLDFYSVGRFPYMARYSELKSLGEPIDNMRRFLINNFKNVDALHGEINNVRVGSQDKLFYWQDKGFGYLPVDERETTVGALGGAIQLGVGGVMERFDTIDKYYGNQHQFSLIEIEGGFVWYDMRRRSFLAASYNGEVINVGIVKGMEDFFANAFTLAEDNSTGNIFGKDQPLMNQGITGVYDNSETVFMTFKFFITRDRPVQDFTDIVDFTVLYNTKLKQFIGITDFAPGIVIEHNGRVYAAKNPSPAIIAAMEYTVGMTVSKNGITYVCILAFTTSDPIAANQEPDFGGSVYWKVAESIHNIHLLGKGDVCKFFGIVYPYELEAVANPEADAEKGFDYIEMYGNDTRITDVYYETSKQTASDTNIGTKDKNFEYIDNSWWFNVALKNGKERLVDHYMKIKVRVKNYLTDPTVSLNVKKRIVYLKTFYRRKK